MQKITPLNNYVFITAIQEELTESGIYMAEMKTTDVCKGEVYEVPHLADTIERLHPGDTILYRKSKSHTFRSVSGELYILKQEDIIAKISN